MMRRTNHISDASRMLTFLKKEEAFYKNTLHNMEQELVRLQIEELTLKAAIRQEQMKINGLNDDDDDKNSIPAIPISTTKNSSTTSLNVDINSHNGKRMGVNNLQETQHSNSIPSPEVDSVRSNITDDRYLEPLILNPNDGGDGELIEFDD